MSQKVTGLTRYAVILQKVKGLTVYAVHVAESKKD